MKLKINFSFKKTVLFIALFFIGSFELFASIIVLHQGATDPTSEGFVIAQLPNALPPSSYGPVFDDQGHDAYFIIDNDKGKKETNINYLLSEEELSKVEDGWILSTKLRILDSNDILDAGVRVEFGNGLTRYTLVFGSTENNKPLVAITDRGSARPIETYTVDDTNGGYHLYEMFFDPKSQKADLYVDNVLAIEGYEGFDSFLPNPWVRFGSDGFQTGSANYNLVKFSSPIDSDCLFQWAEQTYPELFSPALADSQSWKQYKYRYYSDTNTYLGFFLEKEVHLLQNNVSSEIKSVGLVETFQNLAGCE